MIILNVIQIDPLHVVHEVTLTHILILAQLDANRGDILIQLALDR